jgi:hypothetical protein
MHPGPPQANPKWKIHRGLHTLRLGTTSSYYAVSPLARFASPSSPVELTVKVVAASAGPGESARSTATPSTSSASGFVHIDLLVAVSRIICSITALCSHFPTLSCSAGCFFPTHSSVEPGAHPPNE